MRLIAVYLACSFFLYGTPVLADQTRRDAAANSESLNRLDGSLPWSPSPLERFLAQNSPSEMSEASSRRSTLDAQIAELQRERSEISTRGPRAAAIIGGVMTGVGGLVAVSAGLACASAERNSSTDCDTSNAEILYISGGGLAAIGLVTLISGATTLSRRNASRRKIDQKIQTLHRERASMGEHFNAHVQLGERKMLTLSWTF